MAAVPPNTLLVVDWPPKVENGDDVPLVVAPVVPKPNLFVVAV